MSVSTIEGFVENGQIRVPSNVNLPENARVYIVIPDVGELTRHVQVHSPRLANREQAADFRMEIVREKA